MFVWRKVALRCDGRKKRFCFCFCVVFAYVGVPSSAPIVRWMSSWSWLQTDGATRVCIGRQTIELLSACDWCLISAWCLRFWIMLAFVFRARYVLFFYYPETCTWPTGTQVVGGELAISRSKCGFPALRNRCIWVKCVFQKVHRVADFRNSCYKNVFFCSLCRAVKWYFVDKMRQVSGI